MSQIADSFDMHVLVPFRVYAYTVAKLIQLADMPVPWQPNCSQQVPDIHPLTQHVSILE